MMRWAWAYVAGLLGTGAWFGATGNPWPLMVFVNVPWIGLGGAWIYSKITGR